MHRQRRLQPQAETLLTIGRQTARPFRIVFDHHDFSGSHHFGIYAAFDLGGRTDLRQVAALAGPNCSVVSVCIKQMDKAMRDSGQRSSLLQNPLQYHIQVQLAQ